LIEKVLIYVILKKKESSESWNYQTK